MNKAFGDEDPPCQYRMTLAVTPHALRHIRRIVRTHLRRWGMPELSDAAELAVTEVLANVIRHAADGLCALRVLRQDGGIRVEVSDGSPALPVPRWAGELDEDGRGLALLGAITHAWAAEPAADGTGKTVWFELKAGG
jgi:anti-sigma regulatory factor (Ser/Thr protein kinase)